MKRQKRTKHNGKDKNKEPEGEPSHMPPNQVTEEEFFDEEDLYTPLMPPPKTTTQQIRATCHYEVIDNICNNYSCPSGNKEAWNGETPMDMDMDTIKLIDYTLLCLQGSTAS